MGAGCAYGSMPWEPAVLPWKHAVGAGCAPMEACHGSWLCSIWKHAVGAGCALMEACCGSRLCSYGSMLWEPAVLFWKHAVGAGCAPMEACCVLLIKEACWEARLPSFLKIF